jgi:hypothetical protein
MGTNLWNRWIAWRHGKEPDLSPCQIEFIPKLSLNRSDGWVALGLVVENRSDLTVWAEDATIVLADLDANSQTRIPPDQVIHKIRQNIGANDALRLSVAEPIYDAAGRPQGPYSSLVLTTVRYRVLRKWCNVQLETCLVEMAALSPINLHRARWYEKKMKYINRGVDITADHSG